VSLLTLDHDQRGSLVRHLNSMSVAELMRREAASNPGAGGRMVQLLAGG
jgi:hypothetical protein